MYRLASIAAASLLLASSHAIPNPSPLQPRTTDAALEPWVTVNEDGKPSTITPVLSTVDGTPTVISGAPHDVTATVFTTTSYGKVITSTGSAPLPTATGESAGSFAVCNNLDGDLAPWCLPKGDEPLYVGAKYYFTWDPEYFKAPNATVHIVGNYINKTTGEVMQDNAFDSPPAIAAAEGFWLYTVQDSELRYQGSQNISVELFSVVDGKRVEKQGPQITITKRPGPKPDAKGKLPQGAALYIALPSVFGFIIVCVVGTCLWNRHHRRIRLGKVMGRNYDVSKTGRSRFGLKKRDKADKANKANERIQLMEREIEAEGGGVYRDLPDPANRPRRDSDALGSLAGTPTEDRHMDLSYPSTRDERDRSPATGNAFRNELKRQADERS
ncbi:hypothetical protein HD806DRAFT_509542 [Xylariaceae sp. AK1471]|nr:hypothetical protein HD806DRAFT_509542 [Xylariaceae sp. AK1471]